MLKHNQEPTENLATGGRRRGSRKDKESVRDDQGQNQNLALDGEGKGKSLGDGKQRKLSPLRLSISNNQASLPHKRGSESKFLTSTFPYHRQDPSLHICSTFKRCSLQIDVLFFPLFSHPPFIDLSHSTTKSDH